MNKPHFVLPFLCVLILTASCVTNKSETRNIRAAAVDAVSVPAPKTPESVRDETSAEKELWDAARKTEFSVIEKLAAEGFDFNAKTSRGYPLVRVMENYSSANYKPDPEFFWALIKHGAKIAPEFDGDKFLQAAVISNHAPYLPLIKYALEQGADPNARGHIGRTALHWAAENADDIRFLRLLVKFGADVNAKDEDGKTPLISALHPYRYLNPAGKKRTRPEF